MPRATGFSKGQVVDGSWGSEWGPGTQDSSRRCQPAAVEAVYRVESPGQGLASFLLLVCAQGMSTSRSPISGRPREEATEPLIA